MVHNNMSLHVFPLSSKSYHRVACSMKLSDFLNPRQMYGFSLADHPLRALFLSLLIINDENETKFIFLRGTQKYTLLKASLGIP